jgi:Xaa-Pro aminopeptidase
MTRCCTDRAQAYLPIVGSGARAGTLHYNINLKPLEQDWVLVDAGGNFMG